ncbi:hypothetical protein [Actinoplanes sp. URMC 104]|uniref:hypothetical protein n=1 Tax=Actinoplanes sp. URMC 104 TaxID=3423409 RepID=UPI003F1DC922
MPTAETTAAAVRMLAELGLEPEPVAGVVWFTVRTSMRLDDPEDVRLRLQGRPGPTAVWRVNDSGAFERSDPAGD